MKPKRKALVQSCAVEIPSAACCQSICLSPAAEAFPSVCFAEGARRDEKKLLAPLLIRRIKHCSSRPGQTSPVFPSSFARVNGARSPVYCKDLNSLCSCMAFVHAQSLRFIFHAARRSFARCCLATEKRTHTKRASVLQPAAGCYFTNQTLLECFNKSFPAPAINIIMLIACMHALHSAKLQYRTRARGSSPCLRKHRPPRVLLLTSPLSSNIQKIRNVPVGR